jgi:transcriptional regulator with XRE-family HTH domain
MAQSNPEHDAVEDLRRPRQTDFIDEHVGRRMRFRRLALGVSQEELGRQLGLTFQQVQKYEKGVNRIAAGRLFALSRALSCELSFFFDGLPAETSSADLLEAEDLGGFMQSRECVALCHAFMAIDSAAVRRALIVMIRTMADPNPPLDGSSA